MITSSEYVLNTCQDLLNKGKCLILKDLIDVQKKALDFYIMLEAFYKGDTDIAEILMECGEYLGIGIANVINIFNPKMIIIDENDLLKLEYIYDIVIKEANKRAYDFFTNNLKYKKVDIGRKEIIKGISLYVFNKLFELSGSIL